MKKSRLVVTLGYSASPTLQILSNNNAVQKERYPQTPPFLPLFMELLVHHRFNAGAPCGRQPPSPSPMRRNGTEAHADSRVWLGGCPFQGRAVRGTRGGVGQWQRSSIGNICPALCGCVWLRWLLLPKWGSFGQGSSIPRTWSTPPPGCHCRSSHPRGSFWGRGINRGCRGRALVYRCLLNRVLLCCCCFSCCVWGCFSCCFWGCNTSA